MTSEYKPLLVAALVLSLAFFLSPAVVGYTPRHGYYFSYYETQDLGSGTGNYNGYTENTVVNGTENVNGVSAAGIASAFYHYSWVFNNGTVMTGHQSGNFSFSVKTFLYVNGTDGQTARYVNPTVWFYMNNSIPKNGAFYLLDTQMTVMSRNYSYLLPSQNRYVSTIFAEGSSSFQRNDVYGQFTATYTWDVYFDPSTGYIVGYGYVEHDTNPSGDGFTYTENLYVTSTSYPLTAAGGPSSTTTSFTQSTSGASGSLVGDSMQYVYAAVIVLVIVVVGLLIYAASRRSRRETLPKHSPEPEAPPTIDLTPSQQPPVQQVVIREVAKVNCRYCGTLIDSTVDTCPKCGAPRT